MLSIWRPVWQHKSFFYFNLGDPNNVVYLAPSLTTYGHVNPAYRMYYIDGPKSDKGDKSHTNLVLEHSTSYFDLDASIKKVHKFDICL